MTNKQKLKALIESVNNKKFVEDNCPLLDMPNLMLLAIPVAAQNVIDRVGGVENLEKQKGIAMLTDVKMATEELARRN